MTDVQGADGLTRTFCRNRRSVPSIVPHRLVGPDAACAPCSATVASSASPPPAAFVARRGQSKRVQSERSASTARQERHAAVLSRRASAGCSVKMRSAGKPAAAIRRGGVSSGVARRPCILAHSCISACSLGYRAATQLLRCQRVRQMSKSELTTCALCCSSSSATAALNRARCSGGVPSASCALASAPCASRVRTSSASSCATASCSAEAVGGAMTGAQQRYTLERVPCVQQHADTSERVQAAAQKRSAQVRAHEKTV